MQFTQLRHNKGTCYTLTHLMLQYTSIIVYEKVDEQHLQKKLRSCNTFEDTSHLLIR